MGQKMPVMRIDIDNEQTEAKWYTIVTKHNYENKFATNLELGLKNSELEGNILEVIIPIIEEKHIVINKKGETKDKIKCTKLYPNYVFVKAIMNERTWAYIKSTAGCSTVLACGPTLCTMTEDEVNRIKRSCNMKIEKKFAGKINDLININEGPFRGLTGKIIDINKESLIIDLPNNIKAEISIDDVDLV